MEHHFERSHPKTPYILKKLGKPVSNSMEDTVLNKRKLKLCVLAPPLKQGFGSMASDYFSRTQVKSASLVLSSLLLKVDSVFTSVLFTAAFPGLKTKQGSPAHWCASSAKYSLLL